MATSVGRSGVTNLVAIVAVIAIVAGAAWYRAQRPATESNGDARPVAADSAKLPRLVDLGADKCAACKKLAPILDALRDEYKGRLSVEFIDVWKNPDAQKPYNVRLIPTQILYDAAGEEVWRHEGFISKEDLKALFAEKVGVK